MIVDMQILIMAVGKDTPIELRAIQQDYERRLQPQASITWKLLPASRALEPDQIRIQESHLIYEVIKDNDTVVLLDERGIQQTNEAFAQTFEQLAGKHGRLVIVIGGAFGVDDSLRDRADFVWSFSKLVFPHQLMRIMLLEQLYRTFAVQNNHPYHHV